MSETATKSVILTEAVEVDESAVQESERTMDPMEKQPFDPIQYMFLYISSAVTVFFAALCGFVFITSEAMLDPNGDMIFVSIGAIASILAVISVVIAALATFLRRAGPLRIITIIQMFICLMYVVVIIYILQSPIQISDANVTAKWTAMGAADRAVYNNDRMQYKSSFAYTSEFGHQFKFITYTFMAFIALLMQLIAQFFTAHHIAKWNCTIRE